MFERNRDRASQKSFSSSPPRPKKRVKERVAAVARPRHSGNTLFINLGVGGSLPIRTTFENASTSILPQTVVSTI